MVHYGNKKLDFVVYSSVPVYTVEFGSDFTDLVGYGETNPNDQSQYNYIDIHNERYVSYGYTTSDGIWQSYD
jgi:hypothetical protein